MKSPSHAAISACMMLVALTRVFGFACAHEEAHVKVHLRTSSLQVSGEQPEVQAEAAREVHHNTTRKKHAGELTTDVAPLTGCKPANKEPWKFDIRFARVFTNPAGGFDYFYKLRRGLFMRNCFCLTNGLSGFDTVFEDTMLGEVLTSPEEEGIQCYSKANGSGAWTNTVTRASSRTRLTSSCSKQSASSCTLAHTTQQE